MQLAYAVMPLPELEAWLTILTHTRRTSRRPLSVETRGTLYRCGRAAATDHTRSHHSATPCVDDEDVHAKPKLSSPKESIQARGEGLSTTRGTSCLSTCGPHGLSLGWNNRHDTPFLPSHSASVLVSSPKFYAATPRSANNCYHLKPKRHAKHLALSWIAKNRGRSFSLPA
eukprot:1180356-Prorocentrum_minimum.AAC.6